MIRNNDHSSTSVHIIRAHRSCSAGVFKLKLNVDANLTACKGGHRISRNGQNYSRLEDHSAYSNNYYFHWRFSTVISSRDLTFLFTRNEKKVVKIIINK